MDDQLLDSPEFDPRSFEERVASLSQTGYNFDIGETLERALNIFRKQPVEFIAFTLLVLVIDVVLNRIGWLGSIAWVFVNPPLALGYAIVANRLVRGESFAFKDFFKGFDVAVSLVALAVISGALIAIGFVLLIVPGVYLAVAFSLGSLMLYFGKLDIWPALQASRKLVSRQWFDFFLLALVLLLLNIVGLLVLVVGVLVTIPISAITVYLIFDDLLLGSTADMQLPDDGTSNQSTQHTEATGNVAPQAGETAEPQAGERHAPESPAGESEAPESKPYEVDDPDEIQYLNPD